MLSCILRFSAAVLFSSVLLAPASAASDKVALIIGNAAYQYANPLRNPANDAADMTRSLREIGFDVVEGVDLDRPAMERAIREFGSKLDAAKIAIFFYAGHGMQVSGRNYLLPTSAKLAKLADLSFEAVDMQLILDQMEGGKRANLVFLDACRDNPFARLLAAQSNGSRSVGAKGLASVRGTVGTMISFATQPDAVAYDGDGRNSPFTTALLKHIKQPDTDVAIMMRRVRADVLAATANNQVPWDHSSLTDSVILVGGPGMPAPSIAPGSNVKPAVGTFADKTRSTSPLTPTDERSLKPAETFKECDTCPEMVLVPAGKFLMGSSAAQIKNGEGYKDEGPQHEVNIERAFALGKYEVTFSEWDACVAGGGCGGYRPLDDKKGRGRKPVINVSWEDARRYAKWLSQKTGKTYRLLSEAEWEYAARAGTTTAYHFGDDSRVLCTYANVADEAASRKDDEDNGIGTWLLCNDGFKNAAAVGQFKPNPFGLHDMLGNVVEWVEDAWNPNYNGAPKNQTPWATGTANVRIGRGGSYHHLGSGNRSATRYNFSAGAQGNLLGFRVARSMM